jgi:CubicO group peptidase (beta-lactamase class C family)
MRTKLNSGIIAALMLACSGQMLAQSQAPLNRARLDSLFSALEANNKAMGSVTVRKNGQVLYSRTFGFYGTGDGGKLKPTSDTKYRIGSISKMFTSVMIQQLIQEKKLKLTTALSTFFPKLPNAGKITIADLLTHHSGLHNFTNDSSYETWMEKPKSEDEMLALIAGEKPDFKPGQRGEYSNTNFVLLGYIIERITKASYADELQRRIVGKIGLKNTYYGSKIDSRRNEAASYKYQAATWTKETETDMSIPGGAGAIVSTTEDLTQFIESLFNHRLISDASLKTMTTMRDKYGMGVFQMPFYERKAFGHTGGIDGFVSSLGYFPSDSLAIAFTSNGVNYSMNNVLIGLLSIYFDKPYKIPSFATVALSPEVLARYEGVYSSKDMPLEITIAKDGDHLTAQATGQSSFSLEAVSETEFKFEQAGIAIEFKKSPEGGNYQFVLKQGGGEMLFSRK